MYRYLEAHSWWSTLDEKQAPTIEALLKLCRASEVARVIIPNTYYGYGSTLVDDSNLRSIQRHYKASRFKMMQYNLTMSASQFIRNADYREMIESLVEDYPIFDESDHSNLESETQLEFLVDEVAYILTEDESSEVFPLLPDTLAETKTLVESVLCSGDWQARIEWWEYVEIDNDGATPYATKANLAELAVLVSVRYLEMKATGEL